MKAKAYNRAVWKKIKKNLVRTYDRYAKERTGAKKQSWKRRERKEFLLYLQKEKKKTLLEIGAGTGSDSLYFQRHNLDVTAIDISPEMVRFCKKRGLRAFVFDFFYIHRLKKTYDAVYALNCLMHVPKVDFERLLKRIRSILKPSGLFYLGMYGGSDFEGILHDDHYEPKRFFSLYRTEDILAIVQRCFKLEYFRHITPWKDGGTFQSMILRKV
jgi:SAM-dependent methyltransferase